MEEVQVLIMKNSSSAEYTSEHDVMLWFHFNPLDVGVGVANIIPLKPADNLRHLIMCILTWKLLLYGF